MSEPATPRALSPEEEQTLTAVLDEIVPPSDDGKLPGAGQLGLVAYVSRVLHKTPDLEAMIFEGLSVLADFAHARNAPSFAALSEQERRQALAEQGFVPVLALHVYTGYYQNARVLEALGLEPRPPHPKGYEMEPGDLTLLEAVRRRGKLYREC